ncbi:MAG: DNA-binding response OmpR family regulator [Gammaproteobacteria bacterium]|jgi:DNA-binding response OmpR family regulator
MDNLQHILLVEDDAELAEWIAGYLKENNFFVQIINRGDLVEDFVRQNPPDLIILDINLPGCDGFEVCRKLRPFYKQPIVMLTANDEEFDEILGLEIGANDYITKPIAPRVLLARLKAHLRLSQVDPTKSLLRFGSLTIDQDGQTTCIDDLPISLSCGEFELLCALARKAGHEVKREDLIKQIRGFEYDGFDRTIDVRISRLRRKLGDTDSPPKKIKTIWGKGYLFVKNAW